MVNFIYKTGDMFETQAQAIINTVNCVGIMGKGVALEFKNRWKDNFKQYKKACDEEKVTTGTMFVVENEKYNELLNEVYDYQYLINFPTKQHWRSKSKIEYITEGLDDLKKQIEQYNIKSIVIPPLGCGNGQLDWMEVKPIIKDTLSGLDDSVDIILYEPKYNVSCPEHSSKLEMTKMRAILLKTLQDLTIYFGGSLTHLCMQKTVYFLEQVDCDFGAKFAKNKWGPFSEKMETAFKVMEGNGYLNDFSDGETTVSFVAIAETEQYLKDNNLCDEVDHIVNKISLLFEGYESPFGLELLSTVHYCDKNLDGQIVKTVHDWSKRKQEIFTEKMILAAQKRLKQDNFL